MNKWRGDVVLRDLNEILPAMQPITDAGTICIVDVETTGLNPQTDDVISIATVVCSEAAIESVNIQYQEQCKPLPENIKRITGLTDEFLAGKEIDWNVVEAQFQRASLIVAHNARFDRAFMIPRCQTGTWACSRHDLDWRGLGFGGEKLELLAHWSGFHYDAHEAQADCLAVWKLLQIHNLWPELRRKANLPYVRLFVSVPFERKDQIKERGYGWSAGSKTWWRDIPQDDYRNEQLEVQSIGAGTRIVRVAEPGTFLRFVDAT